ncbi:hypothetical protein [Fontivita pretiosa]|uniref:hypothetical protein n=1 Tax=Fontivita pretiosa TaxID=2989684 RepID=UPI003D186AF4
MKYGRAPELHRERPITFTAAMVRALLEGRKTQTRRAVVPQPDLTGRDESGRVVAFRDGRRIVCRFGQVGDRLWVRERWGMSPASCRTVLQVTDVSLERLCRIDRADARAEGFPGADHSAGEDPVAWFRSLWDKLHKPDSGHCWRDDPWVWVIRFELVRATASPQCGPDTLPRP